MSFTRGLINILYKGIPILWSPEHLIVNIDERVVAPGLEIESFS